jgi:hypothetical protein
MQDELFAALARSEAEIAAAEAELAASVAALRHEVRARSDWREWVKRHPGITLGAAFALGLFMGSEK